MNSSDIPTGKVVQPAPRLLTGKFQRGTIRLIYVSDAKTLVSFLMIIYNYIINP